MLALCELPSSNWEASLPRIGPTVFRFACFVVHALLYHLPARSSKTTPVLAGALRCPARLLANLRLL